MKRWATLFICLVLLTSLIACGAEETLEPDASVLRKDIESYIADCLDSNAGLFDLEVQEKKREGDGFSAACAGTYGSDSYMNEAIFSLEYALEKGTWILRQCSVEIGAQEIAGYMGMCGKAVSWLLDENGVLTIGGTGEMADYEHIEEAANTPWWESRDAIQSIVIENGVTSIGASAFYACKNVTSMTIPESITKIGSDAFTSGGLEELFFEGEAPAFGDDVFLRVTATAFYPVSFGGWTNDLMLDYGGSISWIGLSEEEMTSLRAANQLIGGTCGPGLSWTLNEDGILLISGRGTIDASEYDFSSGTCNSPWWAVRDSIQTVFLMNGITSIGKYAFYGCQNLTRIEMPDSILEIGYAAFGNCEKLTEITLPKELLAITPSAVFFGCESLCSVNASPENKFFTSVDGVLFNKNKTKLIWYPQARTASSYSIPDGVTEIGGSAFSYCIGLTSVTIPESVTCIGTSAFYDCVALESVTIPEGVTEISSSAFEGCTGMSRVVIPDSVTKIGYSAFSDCESLTSVTIPDGVTEIGHTAFSNCDKLESVVIPGGLTSMGERVFAYCDNLKHVTVMEGVTMLGEAAFDDCVSLTSVTLPSTLTNISGYAFSYCEKLESITIPSSISTIYNYAFSNCDSLTDVVIPSSVTLIGNGAFRNCDRLSSVTFEGDAPELKGDVFDNTITTVYYSASCSGWTSEVMKNYGGWITWREQ